MQCCLAAAAAAEFAKFLSMLLHFLRVQLCAEVQELHLSLTWMEAAKVRT